jgi:tryptophan-rich hypothetical protein
MLCKMHLIQEAWVMKPLNKLSINSINPAKLMLSKWTAVMPHNKQKHFLVTRVIEDEEKVIVSCILEAVLTNKEYECDWKELKDRTRWLAGWH